jgi:NAD(P)-dependent dehydrogenase (short-subunit alcohol dehydrogenase family)
MKHYAMTGGATGIGAATKAKLLANGHKVTVVDIKDADIVADLGNPESRAEALASLQAAGPFDGVITCAGVASHFPNTPAIISINYYGTVELLNGLKDHLNPGARVVAISSNSAPMCTNEELVLAMLNGSESEARALAADCDGQMCYAGSKQAVARWVKHVAPEWARSGVGINAIAPGYIETPMTKAVAESAQYADAIKQFLASIPMQRAGQPEDIANLIDFLLSDAASFIGGSLIYCDGAHDAMLRPDAY